MEFTEEEKQIILGLVKARITTAKFELMTVDKQPGILAIQGQLEPYLQNEIAQLESIGRKLNYTLTWPVKEV